ncbi:MAG: transcription elongation factor GreA [Chloroflexi bacterium]|nr:transcription elongation factor GreA [Chloroflexota bacterium]
MRRPTGERQAHGLTGSVLPLPDVVAAPPTRVTQLAPGDADGASAEIKGTGTIRRAPSPASAPAPAAGRRAAAPRPSAPRAPAVARIPAAHRGRRDTAEPVELSPAAHARMTEELEHLTQVRRPEVVARIKAARELGDLRENSEYHAAREEQSFLEGRVQLLEQRLRRAVVLPDVPTSGIGRDGGEGDGAGGKPAKARGAGLGSRVTVELNGEEMTWTLVGTTEAKAAEGRISTASPVGAALLGARGGTEVTVRTPRGDVRYRVLSVE